MDIDRPEPELLEHLVVEFSEHGRRAADFLKSAQVLFGLDPDLVPRLANAIAYCIREAMKAIPASQDLGNSSTWKRASRDVVSAKERYVESKDLPGEDAGGALANVMAKIDDLTLIHRQEGVHKQRLIAVMVNRTGALPVAAGTTPVHAYQQLLDGLDNAVHGKVSLSEAGHLWSEAITLLRQLFLPPRNPQD